RTLCGVVSLVAILAMLAAGSGAGSTTRALAGCGDADKDSGNQDAAPQAGVRAPVSTITPPGVIFGQTAAWLGVGGLGLGPHGADEWLQAGYSGFTTGQKQIYYEVTTPGANPQYHTVKDTLDPTEKHVVGVIEITPNVWQAYVDNQP